MKAYRDETTGRWHSDLPDAFDLICQKLRDREPFSFARYGDGEFNAIYGKQGRNCDGHEYFPDMGKRLREALESKPNYIVGLQPLTIASERWPQIQKDFPGIQWVDADSIHNASIDGRLTKLFDSISNEIVLVGPPHLKKIIPIESNAVFVGIQSQNCWLHYDKCYERIRELVLEPETASGEPFVFYLCASMMSEVIIHDFKDSSHTFIDLGSVLDPYAGVKSRRYHHKLAI